MARVAFIMCGGSQTRWGNGEPKQLIPVLGETLVARASRQLRAIGFRPFIVGPSDLFGGHGECIQQHASIAASIESCRRYFEDCTAVVCGDVVWSDGAIGHFAIDGPPRAVLGSFFTSEIFGMCWNHSTGPAREKLSYAHHHGGRLWHIYRLMIGQPIDKHVCDASLWTEINDGFTSDFDFPEQYGEWVRLHP